MTDSNYNPFESMTAQMLAGVEDGVTMLDEINEQIRIAAAALLDDTRRDGPASITVKLRLEKAGEDSVIVVCDDIATKVPKHKRKAMHGICTGDGDVVTAQHRQRQTELPINVTRIAARDSE